MSQPSKEAVEGAKERHDYVKAVVDGIMLSVHFDIQQENPPNREAIETLVKQACDAAIDASHRWIPLSERPPTQEDGDEHGEVLVMFMPMKMKFVFQWWIAMTLPKDRGLLWQPLPKAPEQTL